MKQLIKKVKQWAEDKGIIDSNDPDAQMWKTLEEVDELYTDLKAGDLEGAKVELGDVLVTLIIQCELQGWVFEECLQLAYDKIKDRKGKMVDGQFVKEKQ